MFVSNFGIETNQLDFRRTRYKSGEEYPPVAVYISSQLDPPVIIFVTVSTKAICSSPNKCVITLLEHYLLPAPEQFIWR